MSEMMEQRDISNVQMEASDWLVLMSAPVVSAEDRARFQTWLAADPEHERIYRRQEASWNAIPHMAHLAYLKDAPQPGLAARLSESLAAAFARPLVPAAGFAAALLVAGILFVNGQSLFLGPSEPDYATAVAEIRDVTLADGSVVTLGAASTLDVSFSDTERRATLAQGEAFFSVAKDETRPFTVAAGDTLVRVVGTQFDVHHGTDTVRVSVLEGVVEVIKPEETVASDHGQTPKRVLTAGQQVVAAKRGDIAPVTQVDEADLAPWRDGRLVYVDAYLRDVVADVNRYYPGEIALGDEAAADLQLTLSFRTDQIDRMIEVLTAALPLEADRMAADRIVLRSRPEKG